MAFRTFLDRAGNEWQAFDVVPRAHERRHYDRRSEHEEPEDSSERERRDEHDRRLTIGRGWTLGPSGWLVFERGEDRRRLSPIPDDWFTCPDEQLDAYRESARQVRVDGSLAESTTRNG